MPQPTSRQRNAPADGKRRPRTAKRPRRRVRWLVRILVGVPLLTALLVVIGMRSPLVSMAVAGRLHDMLGVEFRASGVRIGFDGRLVAHHVELIAPGVPGPAGELLTADMATVQLDFSGILSGRIRPVAVRLHEPVVRLSQSLDDDSLNIDALHVSPNIKGPPPSPPRIDTINARIEIGEHTGSTYTALKELDVDGSLTPTDPTLPRYSILLREAAHGHAGAGGMLLSGSLDLTVPSVSLTLSNVSLDDFPPSAVPGTYRDLWRRLNMRGRISRCSFDYDPKQGVRVELHPTTVAIDAPIPSGLPDARDKPLELTMVNGTIRLSNKGVRADLIGLIEGQIEASEVSFVTEGTSLDSALKCTITTQNFVIGKNPGLLRFAPGVVQRRFQNFSGPTAELDARVQLTRGPPTADGPAPLSAKGSIVVRNGEFAFTGFPYQIVDMQGRVKFDDDAIEIVDLHGRGRSGALIRATGRIAPPTDSAEADIQIDALDVPVDEHLIKAMRGRKRIIDVLFNKKEYRRLVDLGLVTPSVMAASLRDRVQNLRLDLARLEQRPGAAPDDAARLKDRIARAEHRLEAPVFDLGGKAQIHAQIRTTGAGGWTNDIAIRFDSAGMVPQPFPFPIHASNVVLHVDESGATLDRGEFHGLNGGSAQLEARVPVEARKPGDPPDVTIRAKGVPVDNLLLHAIPGDPTTSPTRKRGSPPDDAPRAVATNAPALSEPGAGAGLSAKRLLNAMNITGRVDCTAVIPDVSVDDVRYDIDVLLDGLRISPRTGAEGGPRLAVRDVEGAVHVTNGHLSIPWLVGKLTVPPGAPEASNAGALSMALEVGLPGSRQDGSDGQVRRDTIGGWVSAQHLDVTAPVEDLIGLVSPGAADELRPLRARRHPTGRVNTFLSISDAPESDTDVVLSLTDAEKAGVDVLGGRLVLNNSTGGVSVDLGRGRRLVATDFGADASFNGDASGRVWADGATTLTQSRDSLIGPSDLRLRLSDAPLESSLVLAMIGRLFGTQTSSAYGRFEPRGVFDASLRIAGPDGSPPACTGRIEPHSMSFVRDGAPVKLNSVTGAVTFGPDGGRIDGLRAASDGWTASFDGEWTLDDSGSMHIDSAVTLDAAHVDDALLSLVPRHTRDVMNDVHVTFGGPVALTDGRLSLDLDDGLGVKRIGLAGSLAFKGIGMDVGVPIEDLSGRLSLDADQEADAPPRLDIQVLADGFSVAGVRLTDARVVLRSGTRPGNLLFPIASADCHGGRVSASGLISGLTPAADDPLHYEAEVRVEGVRFAPLLAELSLLDDADKPAPAGETVQPPVAAAVVSEDNSRGDLDATLSISGDAGDAADRSGRGAIRITGGDVVQLPLVMPLIQLSNFQLPSNDRLDYLETRFFVVGDNVRFEHVALLADSLSLIGAGRLHWPDKSLDLTFNSMSRVRIPVWSDLFEAVRNELVTTIVRGTVSKPRFSTRPLTTLGAVVGSILGDDAPPRGDTNLHRAERQARAERRRIKGIEAASADVEARGR